MTLLIKYIISKIHFCFFIYLQNEISPIFDGKMEKCWKIRGRKLKSHIKIITFFQFKSFISLFRSSSFSILLQKYIYISTHLIMFRFVSCSISCLVSRLNNNCLIFIWFYRLVLFIKASIKHQTNTAIISISFAKFFHFLRLSLSVSFAKLSFYRFHCHSKWRSISFEYEKWHEIKKYRKRDVTHHHLCVIAVEQQNSRCHTNLNRHTILLLLYKKERKQQNYMQFLFSNWRIEKTAFTIIKFG